MRTNMWLVGAFLVVILGMVWLLVAGYMAGLREEDDKQAERERLSALMAAQASVAPPVVPAGGKVIRLTIRAGLRRRYRLVDLGPFYQPDGNELNMNDTGTITMRADDDKPYLWKAGKRTQLPTSEDGPYTLQGGFEAFYFTRVRAVNDHDIAVGTISDDSSGALTYYEGQPVLWKHGKLAGALPTLPNLTYATAVDINNKGVVLCQSDPDSSMQDPDQDGGNAYLVQKGRVTDLGKSTAVALNNRGEAAGWLRFSDHAALWTHGHWIDLGDLTGSSSMTYGINDRGEVVGDGPGDGSVEAILWRMGPGSRYNAYDLGRGQAFGINNRGEIVGVDDHGHAVLWRLNRVVDLNRCIRAKGWVLEFATHINRHGRIIGFGKRNGKDHGFLLIPVRSPHRRR